MSRPAGAPRRRIDVAEIAMATVLLVGILWHAYVTYSASARITNLLMVVPATAVFVVLWVAIVWRYGIAGTGADAARAPVPWKIPALMALFVAYVVSLPLLGLDGGTALFTAACIIALGERNLVVALTYSAGLGLAVGWLMGRGLSVDAPTLFF